MRKFLATLATGALLATAAMPITTFAQDTLGTEPIVVTGKHQKLWDRGTALEREGQNNLSKAQENLAEANRDVLDAQEKRDNNRDKADGASNDFRQLTSTMPIFTTGKEAARWAKQIGDAAKIWERSSVRSGDGAKDLRDAMRDQSKAQESVDKAQTKIDRGRVMMADAQRQSLVTSTAE